MSADKIGRHGNLPPHSLRLAALIIDFLIVILVVMFGLPQPVRFIFPLGLFFGYHTIRVWRFHRSFGKALLGLRVRVGKRPTLLWSLGRSTLGYFGADLLGLGLLVGLFDARRRYAHDYVFESFVIFEGLDAVKVRKAVLRLSTSIERWQNAVEEKIVRLGFLTVPVVSIFKGLRYFASKTNEVLNYLAGGAPAGSAEPVGILLNKKATAIILAASTAASAGTLMHFPAARFYLGKLIVPHYVLREPPADWVPCGCPRAHQWSGAYYGFTLYHPANIYCP
jgi:uncharacterized RDD family membrane protein YckC